MNQFQIPSSSQSIIDTSQNALMCKNLVHCSAHINNENALLSSTLEFLCQVILKRLNVQFLFSFMCISRSLIIRCELIFWHIQYWSQQRCRCAVHVSLINAQFAFWDVHHFGTHAFCGIFPARMKIEIDGKLRRMKRIKVIGCATGESFELRNCIIWAVISLTQIYKHTLANKCFNFLLSFSVALSDMIDRVLIA